MQIQELIETANERGASDLHLASGQPPSLRVDGHLETIGEMSLDDHHMDAMLQTVMSDEQWSVYSERKELDFAVSFGDAGRFRANAFTRLNGRGLVLRAIPEVMPTLEDLGAPSILSRIAGRSRGLVLVTGPTGSGKSTTLAAMVNQRNRNYPEHILTIEDPIEFVHDSRHALVTQREVGEHTHNVNNALRSALREDPDVILIGELRDAETIRLALTAAETGHLVLGTLHTRTAASSVDRIINTFPGEEQPQVRAMLADSMVAVISQTLIRQQGGGRVAGYEIMVANPAIRNLIRESNLAQIPNALQTGQAAGMQTMEQSVKRLQGMGLIAEADAKAALDAE